MASEEEIKSLLSQRYNITFDEQLTLGNVCKSVFRARLGQRSIVVKIGINSREKAEITQNQMGYKLMADIGVSSLIPEPLRVIQLEDVLVILMQDCGNDFWHSVQLSGDPIRLYRRLISETEKIYRASLSQTVLGVPGVLNALRDRLIRQYEQYLFPVFGKQRDMVKSLSQVDFQRYTFKMACFSTFDFTPEDVFLTPKGLKFCDPPSDLIGIPVIDMACFAGVSRDAYVLPGSSIGYILLEHFATNIIPDILGFGRKMAISLFEFGRALQCSLSARFRIKTDFEKASLLYNLSCDHCRMFLYLNSEIS